MRRPLTLLALLLCAPAWAQTGPAPDAPPPATAPSEIVTAPPQSGPVCEGSEELFLALSRERDLIAEVRTGLDRERAELDLTREAVRQETARLTELRDELRAVLDQLIGEETAELSRLVAVYEAMKPEEAARLLDGLDMSVTMMIFSTMQERRAGPILARMSPVRAQAISRILVEMAKLPEDRNLEGIRLR